ncbi:hypothetical protein [Xanthobacter tagetidis]|jgi:hypothetical protein|uniref:Uncharacterized protein n=1 Tax=Xanthobacter tagetidis TaxID=60216 RepID=A0A3L7ANY6_9HYPH|nr:hypothetical protein [Xanthobacter tagetidis]MBB6308232.1 hypothetical protein [Xanthobacter tagetidis]RLP81844.1 hypothetical protein D9R14_02310 [Xanthobacter tagetidis]
MESPRVYVYQFATGAQWAAGDSVEAYLRHLLDVDFLQGLRADRLAAVSAFLDEAFQLAHTLGWSGRAREMPQMFSLPGMPADEAVYMVAWEQDDGVAYIASPYPLPWLDAKATRTTDSSRAIPVDDEERDLRPAAAPEPVALRAEPAAEEADPLEAFADFVRREETTIRLREAAPPAEEEREAGRRFF